MTHLSTSTNAPAGISGEGAHHVANDPRPKESPAMTHSVSLGAPTVDSPRGRQLAAVLVVSKLLQLDLPEACNWSIEADRLVVQLAVHRDAATSVAALTRWADFLGVSPRAADHEPYETPVGVLRGVNINATYRGLSVLVYDGVPVDAIPAEWLAEREAS